MFGDSRNNNNNNKKQQQQPETRRRRRRHIDHSLDAKLDTRLGICWVYFKFSFYHLGACKTWSFSLPPCPSVCCPCHLLDIYKQIPAIRSTSCLLFVQFSVRCVWQQTFSQIKPDPKLIPQPSPSQPQEQSRIQPKKLSKY